MNIVNFRPEAEADQIVALLLTLKPIQSFKKLIEFAQMTDSAEPMNVQGGLKTAVSCGLQSFKGKNIELGLEEFTTLVEDHPSASRSLFMTNWYSTDGMRRIPDTSSAYSHRDIGVWR